MCINFDKSVIYIADDVNGLLPVAGTVVDVPFDSRIGPHLALRGVVYNVLKRVNLPDSHVVQQLWSNTSVNAGLSYEIDNRFPAGRAFTLSIKNREPSIFGGVELATLYCDWHSENHYGYVRTLYHVLHAETVDFVLEDPRTNELTLALSYRFADPTPKELRLVTYGIAFIRGATRIEFADQSNTNRHIKKLSL